MEVNQPRSIFTLDLSSTKRDQIFQDDTTFVSEKLKERFAT